MLSRNGSYAKTPDVVIRTFEEWGHAYAFTPSDPEILDLNASATLIVELCDGRPYQQIQADYVAVVGKRIGTPQAQAQFEAGFSELLERNVISASEQ